MSNSMDEGSREWPTCPECGARRIAMCPVCQTSGTNFPAADANYWTDFVPAAQLTASASAHESNGRTGMRAAAEPGPVVLCPTCDEPFTPAYLRRCEWCGHIFESGLEVDVVDGEAEDDLNARTIGAIVATLVLGLLLALYFAWIW